MSKHILAKPYAALDTLLRYIREAQQQIWPWLDLIAVIVGQKLRLTQGFVPIAEDPPILQLLKQPQSQEETRFRIEGS